MSEKRAVTNTTQQVNAHPEGFLLESLARGTSGAIEAQEARGQQEFVRSTLLPVRGTSQLKERAIWEKMGIKLGEVVEGDDIFCHAELPPGWTKRPTEHSMWSELLDDKGRVRAQIFYKAAFYDRNAHIHPERRFSTRTEFVKEDDYNGPCYAAVLDGKKEIFRSQVSEPGPMPPYGEETAWTRYQEAKDRPRNEARAWLKEHYPKFDDPTAYWD